MGQWKGGQGRLLGDLDEVAQDKLKRLRLRLGDVAVLVEDILGALSLAGLDSKVEELDHDVLEGLLPVAVATGSNSTENLEGLSLLAKFEEVWRVNEGTRGQGGARSEKISKTSKTGSSVKKYH